MLKYAVQRERYADIAVESLSAGTLTQRRFWLFPALFAVTVITVLTTAFLGISTHGSRTDTRLLRPEIARLNNGLRPQSDLLRRAEQERSSIDTNPRSALARRDSLKAQSEDLRKKVAASVAEDVDSLKLQLLDTQKRLSLLEKEGKFAETVVHKYGASVCMLHVVVEFVDKQSGKPLQAAVDANGKPQIDDKGMAEFEVGGGGA